LRKQTFDQHFVSQCGDLCAGGNAASKGINKAANQPEVDTDYISEWHGSGWTGAGSITLIYL
jgi:hypothetical protein